MNKHPFETIALDNGAKLLFTPCPGTKLVGLEESIQQLKENGISMLITLMFDEEMASNKVLSLPELCHQHQISWLQLHTHTHTRTRTNDDHHHAPISPSTPLPLAPPRLHYPSPPLAPPPLFGTPLPSPPPHTPTHTHTHTHTRHPSSIHGPTGMTCSGTIICRPPTT